jgi:hypothetical protein
LGIVVEAYPGVLVMQLIGRAGYKTDNLGKQTEKQHQIQRVMLDHIQNG